MAISWLVPILLLSTVDMASGRTPRLGTSREKEYLNPDIAIGKQFHVAAKQWDGATRCYFIDVGSSIEQGATNIRSNEQCAHSYQKEIGLGRYDGTLTPDSSPTRVFMQKYVNGDSVYCGTEVGGQHRKGLVDPSNGPKARQVRRQTTLVMLKNEGQVGITARVREPRRCKYEVTLEGPQLLLLGGAPGETPSIGPAGEAPKRQGRNGRSNVPAKRVAKSKSPASEARKEQRATGSKPSRYAQGKYAEALKVVKQSSREELLSRPAKELKKLLRHLDVECKGCNEKEHFADRLVETLRGKDEL